MNTSSRHHPNKSPWRHRTLAIAITAALAATCGVAQADNANAVSAADQTAQEQTDNRTVPSQRNATDRDAAQDLGAIQVTATGRTQKQVEVPYNISVVTGDDIQQNHVLDAAELFRSIPGVNVIDSGPRNSSVVNSIRIRGINVDSSAMGDYAVTAAAPVATYVDSVPLYANFLLFDIDRVEVLRGPQGTLYGSGSLGGTVRYVLAKPQMDEFSGSVSGSLSSVKSSSSIGNSESVVLNVPLGQSWAMRFDGLRNDFPGITDYRNVYDLDANGIPVAPDGVLAPTASYHEKKDADTTRQNYGRVALRLAPNDAVDVQLSYMAQADRFGARRGTSLGTDGWGEPYGRNELGAIQLEPSKRHVNLTALEASVDMGFATLTSSTSHYNHEGDIVSDNTGFYAKAGWYSGLYYNYPRPMSTAVRSYGDKAFTQEFRLVSDTHDTFDYVAGLYYRNQRSYSTQTSELRGFKQWWDAFLPDLADLIDPSSNDYSYLARGHYRETALYGQGTWHATDTLDLTLGVRSFRDKFDATVDSALPLWVDLFPPGHASSKQDNSKTLFYGNLSWWMNGGNQLYATVSEGYRRGGANGTPTEGNFAEDPAWLFYQPDKVLNHELGLKGVVGNVSYTADVFLTKWKNPQLNTSTSNWGFFAVQNMGGAKTQGVEFEMQARAGDNFTYGLGYTYTDAKLSKDAWTPDGILINTDGARLPGVSKHHANVFGNYSLPLGQGLMTLHMDASYQSDSENALSRNPLFSYRLPGFTMVNAGVSYNLNAWTASLWLKNITNTKGITGVYTEDYMGTNPDEQFFGNGSKAINAVPRTIGATFTYWF